MLRPSRRPTTPDASIPVSLRGYVDTSLWTPASSADGFSGINCTVAAASSVLIVTGRRTSTPFAIRDRPVHCRGEQSVPAHPHPPYGGLHLEGYRSILDGRPRFLKPLCGEGCRDENQRCVPGVIWDMHEICARARTTGRTTRSPVSPSFWVRAKGDISRSTGSRCRTRTLPRRRKSSTS